MTRFKCSVVFFCFTHSANPLLFIFVLLCSDLQLALMGFIDITFDMCHPSTLALILISLSINQNVNLGSTPSSVLLVPFCLPRFFPSPSTFHWLKSQILPPRSVFSTFLLSSSLSVPGARLALRLFNCHGLGRRKMKVEQVGEGRVGSGLESGVE